MPHLLKNARWRALVFIQLIWEISVLVGQPIQVEGKVATPEGEPISNALVIEGLTQEFTRTEEDGTFALAMKAQRTTLIIRAEGYRSLRIPLLAGRDTTLAITLSPRTLSAVEITDSSTVLNVQDGANHLRFPIEKLARLPMVLGEPDVLRALTLLPGIDFGLEGTTGVLVRGARPGQNLMLLDGASIYNNSHLFGLVSAYNADVLRSVDVYKGWFPARYGGRIASVIDLQTKQGDTTAANQAAIGLINARMTLQGKLGRGETRYMLGVRAAYLNLFTFPLLLSYRNGSAEQSFSYWLYDANANLSHRWSGGQRLQLTLYQSQDDWRVREGRYQMDESVSKFAWRNTSMVLRYDHPLSIHANVYTQVSVSGYQFRRRAQALTRASASSALRSTEVEQGNGIQDYAWQGVYRRLWGAELRLEIGLKAGMLGFVPERFRVTAPDLPQGVRSDTSIYAGNYASWLEVQWDHAWWSLTAGMRLSGFQPRDTLFLQWEPRVEIRLGDVNAHSFSASYARTSQAMHWLSPTQIGLPGDLWLPASPQLPVQVAQQWAAGVSSKWGEAWRTEIAGYWRQSTQEIAYQPSFIANDARYEEVLANLKTGGMGRAYGIELATYLEQKRLSGWLSYTLAWSELAFDAEAWQPAPFDQRHQVDINVDWRLSQKVRMSCNWVFRSGRPVYLPQGQVRSIDGWGEFFYGDVPSRMPTYHRMDVGLEIKAKRPGATWQVGVYNVYNRLNALFLTYRAASSSTFGLPPNQTIIRTPAEVRAQGGIPFLPYLSYRWTF